MNELSVTACCWTQSRVCESLSMVFVLKCFGRSKGVAGLFAGNPLISKLLFF